MFWRKRKKQEVEARTSVTTFEQTSGSSQVLGPAGASFTTTSTGPTVVSFSSSTGDLDDPAVQEALRQAGQVLDQMGLGQLPGLAGATVVPAAADPDDERYESLQQAAKLYEDGVLTLDEFEAEKKRILRG